MDGILCYSSQVGDLLTGGIAPKALTSAFGWAVVGREDGMLAGKKQSDQKYWHYPKKHVPLQHSILMAC